MSRAFVKEGDGDDEVPALRIPSAETNYVTPRGHDLLRDKVKALMGLREQHLGSDDLSSQAAVREADRELAYYVERLRTAVPVEPVPNLSGQVRFGSRVETLDETGERLKVMLVGEDEADIQQGLISYVSPLAKALMGAHVGDEVIWERPAGRRHLEITLVDGVSD